MDEECNPESPIGAFVDFEHVVFELLGVATGEQEKGTCAKHDSFLSHVTLGCPLFFKFHV